jgi:hypothetical protein
MRVNIAREDMPRIGLKISMKSYAKSNITRRNENEN